MYPFEDGLDFVRNGWYAAAWAHDVGDAVLARTFLDEPVILYRTSDGEAVALTDRCAHRAYPLSLGTRIGDTIRCGYHGFTDDGTGRCVAIPAQEHIPAAYRVRRYPTIERGGLVFIWMGDPALADPGDLPDLFELGLTDPRFHVDIGGLNTWQNRYQLINENLLDLSHIEFLHFGTIGTPNVAASPVVTTVHANAIEATRTSTNSAARPTKPRSRRASSSRISCEPNAAFAPRHTRQRDPNRPRKGHPPDDQRSYGGLRSIEKRPSVVKCQA
jgi:vanillate O-demethylase monooxygenase subunit